LVVGLPVVLPAAGKLFLEDGERFDLRDIE
jgi:hypothetical protein